VMLMPGFWVTARADRSFLAAQVQYGRALGAHATEHGSDGTSPIVNPMNPSEVELGLLGGADLVEQFRLLGGLNAAVPVSVTNGVERAAAVVGVELTPLAWIDVGTELQLPVLGNPFLARTAIWVATRF